MKIYKIDQYFPYDSDVTTIATYSNEEYAKIHLKYLEYVKSIVEKYYDTYDGSIKSFVKKYSKKYKICEDSLYYCINYFHDISTLEITDELPKEVLEWNEKGITKL